MFCCYLLIIYLFNIQSVNTVFQDLFHMNNNGWKIVGNKNVDNKRKDDSNLWYFGKQFPANFSLVNSSIFSFTMTSFVGDFKNPNNPLSALLRVTNNVTNELIVFPVNHLIAKYNGSFQEFIVPMVNTVWLNGRNYTQIGLNHFKNVLKNVAQIEILGDWTRGNETMGLDNIMIG